MDKELEKEIPNNVQENLEESIVAKKQNNFLESTLGKTLNVGIDIALRTILPNVIENQIIDLKNVLLKEGLQEGIKSAIDSTIRLGKSALGIVTGEFENISQAYTAVKKGGIIDTTSKALDVVIKSANKNGLINENTAKIIKGGKRVIKECLSSNIEKNFLEQIDSMEKIGKYIENWNNYLQNRDLKGMKREHKKINEKMKEVLPIENTLAEVKKINNIQELIKNKGGNLENLTNEEIELAKML